VDRGCGYGLPVDDPSIPGKLEKYIPPSFADSVLNDGPTASDWNSTRSSSAMNSARGTKGTSTSVGTTLPKGLAGRQTTSKYQGIVGGVGPRVETHLEWQDDSAHPDPSWDIKGLLPSPRSKAIRASTTSTMVFFPKPGVDLSESG